MYVSPLSPVDDGDGLVEYKYQHKPHESSCYAYQKSMEGLLFHDSISEYADASLSVNPPSGWNEGGEGE